MCVAVPMQIISLDSRTGMAKVSLHGTSLDIDVSLVNPRVGEYVLVHAGCAIETVAKETAVEILELFADLQELGAHEHS